MTRVGRGGGWKCVRPTWYGTRGYQCSTRSVELTALQRAGSSCGRVCGESGARRSLRGMLIMCVDGRRLTWTTGRPGDHGLTALLGVVQVCERVRGLSVLLPV